MFGKCSQKSQKKKTATDVDNRTSLTDLVRLTAAQRRSSKSRFFDLLKSATSQAASHFITEFSGVEPIQLCDRLSIELGDGSAVRKAVSRYALRNQCDHNPVPFSVRDLDKDSVMFNANITPEQGFVLTNPQLSEDQKEVMVVSWPGNFGQDIAETTVGTLSHPAGVVLFKINRVASASEANVYKVIKAAGKDWGCIFSAVETPTCALLTKRCFGMTFDGSRYDVMDGAYPLAHIIPKVTRNSHVYQINFIPGTKIETETKAAILGIGLLFTMETAYPELTSIHEENDRKTT